MSFIARNLKEMPAIQNSYGRMDRKWIALDTSRWKEALDRGLLCKPWGGTLVLRVNGYKYKLTYCAPHLLAEAYKQNGFHWKAL